jgi:hypothetical protein
LACDDVISARIEIPAHATRCRPSIAYLHTFLAPLRRSRSRQARIQTRGFNDEIARKQIEQPTRLRQTIALEARRIAAIESERVIKSSDYSNHSNTSDERAVLSRFIESSISQ